MSQIAEAKVAKGAEKTEEKVTVEMVKLCNNLFKEWVVNFTLEEKEIWLWNALVEMAKIKQRRNLNFPSNHKL